MCSIEIIVNHTLMYLKVAKRLDLKYSHFYFINILYIYNILFIYLLYYIVLYNII